MFYKNKKVLVTGGSGFVGRHLVEELLKEGALVRIPVHRTHPAFESQNVELHPADLCNPEDCKAAASDVQYVFHAAGVVGSAGNLASLEAINTNLILTARMLEASWKAGVERFLLFSSSTVYPVTSHPVKEEEMWLGNPFQGYFGYGWMRRYLERLAEFVAAQSAMKIAILRPTAPYGRHDNFQPGNSHVIPALIRRASEREDPFVVWGGPGVTRDFLHVSDLARGSLMLLEKHAECDPVNIGYGAHVTISEVVDIILRAADHLDARVIFDETKPTAIPVRMVDIAKARKLLNFAPQITLSEGLQDTVRWYRTMENRR